MDGYIEQWGITITESSGYVPVIFPIIFSDINYNASAIQLRTENTTVGSNPIGIANIHDSYFTIFFNSNIRISWSARGY